MEKNVRYIPPIASIRATKIGIYARVSTNSIEQLESLSAQVSALTRLVAATPRWILVDVYMDVATAKGNSGRKEFNRMLDDVKSKKLNIVLTKSVSRFGRDTVETLEALKILRDADVRIILENEKLDSADTDSNLMISIVESFAQAENEIRSENIKWGLEQRAAQGTSKLYDRKCYGYSHDGEGRLIIDDAESRVVRQIFQWYLKGKSVLGILRELENQGIKSPTGKDKWCKRTIEVMLSNEKYTGAVHLFDSENRAVQYLSSDNHPAVISKETFDAVQLEKSETE